MKLVMINKIVIILYETQNLNVKILCEVIIKLIIQEL